MAQQGLQGPRQFARPSVEHVSLGRGLRVVILLVLWAGGSVASFAARPRRGGLPGGGHHPSLGVIVSFFVALY
jgi:hypothetical protein